MKVVKNVFNIYVECAALFDLRAGAIRVEYPELADKILEEKYALYRERLIDSWDGIPVEEFRAHLKKPSFDYLMNSEMTEMIFHLRQLAHETSKNKNLDLIDVDGIIVHLDFSGFDLMDYESSEFCEVVERFMPSNVRVVIMDKGVNNLKIEDLENIFDVLYIYNIHSFITSVLSELETKSVTDVLIFTPSLIRDPEFFTDLDSWKGLKDPFEATSLSMSDYIQINFLEVRQFSFVHKNKK